MSLLQALIRLNNEVNPIVQQVLNEAFPTLDVYIEQRMNLGMRPKTGNKTDKVYVNTGRLKRSFTIGGAESIQRFNIGRSGVELQYGTTVPYAIFNELGTKHIKARPFLNPAIQQFFDDDIQGLQDEIENKLREVFK